MEEQDLSHLGRWREFYLLALVAIVWTWLVPNALPDVLRLPLTCAAPVALAVRMKRADWFVVGRERRQLHQFGRRIAQRLCDVGVGAPVVDDEGRKSVEPATVRTVVRRGGATTVRLVVPTGHSAESIVRHSDELAAALDARAVTVDALPTAGLVDVTVHAGLDPLDEVRSDWPGLSMERTSWLDPIPVGWNSYGENLTMRLWQAHVLCAGQNGSGKSVWLHQLMLWAALDPSVTMLIVDPKAGAELGCYRTRAAAFACDQAEAVQLFRQVRAEIERRNREASTRKADGMSAGQRPVLLFIDELAAVLSGGDRRLAMEAVELLQYIVAVGRSRGITVIAGTQRPSADLIPSSIRSQFQYIVAFRLQRASDTAIVFGDNPPGVHPERIPLTHRGVGYLMTDEGALTRFRSFYLDDEVLFVGQSLSPSPLLRAAAERHDLALIGGVTDDGEPVAGDEADAWDPPDVQDNDSEDAGRSTSRPDRPPRRRSPRASVRDRQGGDET